MATTNIQSFAGDISVTSNILMNNEVFIKTNDGNGKVAIGLSAGENTQGQKSVAIGNTAGQSNQGSNAVAVGRLAGNVSQGIYSVSIGNETGTSEQGNYATAIGPFAGKWSQGVRSVAVGYIAGETEQSSDSVAMGNAAGRSNQGTYGVAVGVQAGETSQGNNSVAIGRLAGGTEQSTSSVAIGNTAGQTSQGASCVAVGVNAGKVSQGNNSVAVGNAAGRSNQGDSTVAVGHQAGDDDQGDYAIAVGRNAGLRSQGVSATAVGRNAGYSNQSDYATAVGISAGLLSQGQYAVAVGESAGRSNQGAQSVAVGQQAGLASQGQFGTAMGHLAGQINQGTQATALGFACAQFSQGTSATAVGYYAGYSNQGAYATAVGLEAGRSSQGSYSVGVGYQAGYSNQAGQSVAVGYLAGKTSQGGQSVAVGDTAGEFNQGDACTAVGLGAGQSNQGNYGTAVGWLAGEKDQSTLGVAVGHRAGQNYQGTYSIAIGPYAGQTSQGADAIALGRSAGATSQPANSFYVSTNSVRANDSTTVYPLAYINSTGEVVKHTGVTLRSDGIHSDHWLRAYDSDGLYFQTYGGGWHMNENSFVRCWGNKAIYTANTIRTTAFQLDTYYNYAGNYADNWGFYNGSGTLNGYIENDNLRYTQMNFTGQHRTFIKFIPHTIAEDYKGLVVSANNNEYIKMSGGTEYGANAITINESLPVVSLSNVAYDKKCFGVISDSEDPESRVDHYGSFATVFDKDDGDTRIYINSVGEGALWVINANGNVESGDYITTSNVPGYAMRQDDDILHSYTVAKSTMDCDFNPITQPKKEIIKALSNVTYWCKTEEFGVELEEYSNLAPENRTSKIITEYKNSAGKTILEDTYSNLTPSEAALWTPTETTKYYKVNKSKSKVKQEGAEPVIFEEEIPVLDENNEIQWRYHPTETEKAYQIRYINVEGKETDEANADFTAAFIGCTYHCG